MLGSGIETRVSECEGSAERVGTKFVVLHSLGHPGLDELIRKIYETCKPRALLLSFLPSSGLTNGPMNRVESETSVILTT